MVDEEMKDIAIWLLPHSFQVELTLKIRQFALNIIPHSYWAWDRISQG